MGLYLTRRCAVVPGITHTDEAEFLRQFSGSGMRCRAKETEKQDLVVFEIESPAVP